MVYRYGSEWRGGTKTETENMQEENELEMNEEERISHEAHCKHTTVKVCSQCKQTDFVTLKYQIEGSRFSMSQHFCNDCEDVIKTEYIERLGFERVNKNLLLREALSEVARLTKRLKRHEDAQDARAAKLEALLHESTGDAEKERQEAAAVDVYENMGRDEWPTMS